jgi:DNA repair exonuclease SbcCD ATPase subunit
MTKFTAFTIAAILSTALAALIITQQRSEITRLRTDIQSLREERDELSNLVSENARLLDLIRRIGRTEASSNEPPRQLLRLRGEVARLRQDNEQAYKLRQEKMRRSRRFASRFQDSPRAL